MRRLTILFVLMAFALGVEAQASGMDQVQAIVSGPLTAGTARAISDRLAARPGVLLCRVDPISRNLLLHVEQHCDLSEESLEHFFVIHGLHLRCYVRAARNSGPFRLLDPRTCGSMEPIR